MVELVCGLEQTEKLEAVPLSNDVIRFRIVYISFNIPKHVIEKLAASPFPFSMQVNETTDDSPCSCSLCACRRHQSRINFVSLFWKLQSPSKFSKRQKNLFFFAKQNLDWKEKLHLCIWFCYFSGKGSSSLRRHSLLFTQTWPGNKESPNNPERSVVNSHKSHQLIRSRSLNRRM
jgi:hypothetical protein